MMLESENQPPSEIVVLLADEEETRRLNRKFRGVGALTDVLSFQAGPGPEVSPRVLLGDIAICLPIAEKQAKYHLTPLHTELAALAVHGGLHLLGYDDATAEGRAEMNAKMVASVRAAGLEPAEGWASIPY